MIKYQHTLSFIYSHLFFDSIKIKPEKINNNLINNITAKIYLKSLGFPKDSFLSFQVQIQD